MKDSEIVRSCETCVSRCSTPMKTCLAENFLLYRPDFALLAKQEAKTEEAPQKEAEGNTLSDEQAWLQEQYINDDPQVKKRKERVRKETEQRKKRRAEDPEYAERQREQARNRYWRDPEKYRESRRNSYYRQVDTPEKRKKLYSRIYKRIHHIKENDPERYEAHLARKREKSRAAYRNYSDEQRLAHNKRALKSWHMMILTETPEHKEERRKRDRERKKQKFDSLSPEEQQTLREKRNARKRELRAAKREQKNRNNKPSKNNELWQQKHQS